MKRFGFAFAIIVALAAVGCSSDEPGGAADNQYERINLSRGEAEVAEAGYGFAWNLFDKMSGEHEGENLCLSPLNANIALTMLLNGAEGETLDEIVNALGLEGMSVDEINENSRFLVSELLDRDKKCTLKVANSVWVSDSYTLKNSYKNTLAEYFDATAENTTSADYATDINLWCSKHTNGLINDLVSTDEYSPWTLLNAMYFQNAWNEDVKFKGLGQMEFSNYDGTSSMASYMNGYIPCHYGETQSARHAHIAFGNGAYYMSVTLPNEGASIEQCIAELKDHTAFSQVVMAKMDLTMPKFEFKNNVFLDGALHALGVNAAYDRERAQFHKMSDKNPCVGFVKHGCSMKVDEKGAVAAAVTMVGSLGAAPSARPEPMVVDRPFIFTIYESSTQCILFMGKIEKF